MPESVTTMTLPQLVDLSLNCPEMGTLNFNVLHTLLHVLIQQAGTSAVAVEFHGVESDRIQAMVKTSKPAPKMTLTEYQVIGGEKVKKRSKKLSLTDVKNSQSKDEVKTDEGKVVERKKNSKDEALQDPLKTIVVVDPPAMVAETPCFSVAMTKEHLDLLENEVKTVKQQLSDLAELPGNFGLLEASRDKNSPILDMFQILSLTKRVEGAEGGVAKLASLVEDLAREQTHLASSKSSKAMLQKASDIRASLSSERLPIHASKSIERRLNAVEETLANLAESGQITVFKTKKEDRDELEGDQEGEDGSVKQKRRSSDKYRLTSKEETTEPRKSELEGVDLSDIPTAQAMVLIQKELENLSEMVTGKKDCCTELLKEMTTIKSKFSGDDMPSNVKIGEIEAKFSEFINQINNLDLNYNEQLSNLQNEFNKVQNEVADLLARIGTSFPGGDAALGEQSTQDLYNNYLNLEAQMNAIADTANSLVADKEERQKIIDVILEQVDLLKIVKANREDLEDALGDKADACMINRKVSHDQFDQACDDLSRGIEEALSRLTEQQQMWQQALDEIQAEIGNKLDKMEVDPLKDFVNNKLKTLNEKFKTLAALKKEQEAAGTKSRFLRNVNCISCDKDVVMRKEMDVSLRPQPHALAPSRNMAPYLAYELDNLRKQQKCFPNSKNLNQFENALKLGKASKTKNHVCNRYCGGSHTVTTPQQRVTRLGHFLEQWGPEVAPVNDEYIRGNDNHMYRARDDSLLNQLAYKNSSEGSAKMKPRASMVVHGDILTPRNKPEDPAVTKDSESGGVKESRKQSATTSPEAEAILTAYAADPSKTNSESAVLTAGIGGVVGVSRTGSRASAGRNSGSAHQSAARLSAVGAKSSSAVKIGGAPRASTGSVAKVSIGPSASTASGAKLAVGTSASTGSGVRVNPSTPSVTGGVEAAFKQEEHKPRIAFEEPGEPE